jgi:hypothetical protein
MTLGHPIPYTGYMVVEKETEFMEARNVEIFQESAEVPPPHRLSDPRIRRVVGSVETISPRSRICRRCWKPPC